MSDGPYRTLPMSAACKRLARRAEKRAFEPSDIAEAVCPTLEAHWAHEVPRELIEKVRANLDGSQLGMFDTREASFESLRRIVAGRGALGGVFLDCLEQTV